MLPWPWIRGSPRSLHWSAFGSGRDADGYQVTLPADFGPALP
jgi:hypothetical protein